MRAKIEDLEFECTPQELYEILKMRANDIIDERMFTKEMVCKGDSPLFNYGDRLKGKLIQNTRFKDGQKLYYPYFNPQIGSFCIIDKIYKEEDRCGEDKYNLMLCASYAEAEGLCFCLNASIKEDIRNRKLRIHQFEKIHEDETLDRDTQTD